MRLIDADEMALNESEAYMSAQSKIDNGITFAINSCVHGKIQKLIADTPTVDAVSVVRCKDCAKRGTRNCGFSFEHEFSGLEHWEMDDDYCRLGVRRADE